MPENIEEVNAEWFSSILGKTVDKSTFALSPMTEVIGFLSTLVRVQFKTEDDPNTLRQVIVKLLPSDPQIRDDLLKDNLDKLEILSYKILLPEIAKEVPGLSKYICDTVFAEIQEADPKAGIPYNSVLVMKDLKPEGYHTLTITQGLQPEHMAQGLDCLASLHVGSLSLERRLKSKILQTYPWFPECYYPGENQGFPISTFTYFPFGVPVACRLLENIQNLPDTVNVATILKIQQNFDKIVKIIFLAGQKFSCLTHADLWTYNLLLKDDPASTVKVIDWQLAGYSDPAYDVVLYILFFLPMETLTVDGVQNAVKDYFKRQTVLVDQLGLPHLRNWKEFEEIFNTFGLAFGFILSMGCPMFQTGEPVAEKKFQQIIEIMVQMNVFEFMLALI